MSDTPERNLPFGMPIIGEEEKQAVLDVLSNPMLVHGPRSKAFEQSFARYVGAEYAVSVSSCTAALHLSYLALGIGPGDEVIVPAQTHVATAHSVEICGATPIFADAEAETGNIDIDAIEEAITEATKAISVVHYLGMPVDMGAVMKLAKKHDLFVVEDCALAIGSTFDGTHVGLIGDMGCFSFYPVKHMTTAEGGMLITRHEKFARQIERLRAFGVDRTVAERSMPGIYDVTMLGINYRMNEIQAAIGNVQIGHLDEFLRVRGENYSALSDYIAGIDGVSQLKSSSGRFVSSYYCHAAILNDSLADKRPEIVKAMKQRGVGTSVYYPKPLPHTQYYREKYNYSLLAFPNARRISDHGIALPVGPHLGKDDMAYIANALKDSISDL